jgi:prolyl oligopeptidase
VVSWTRAQDAYARAWVAGTSRDSIRDRIATIAGSRRFGVPQRGGDRYYYIDADASFSRRSLVEESADGTRRTLLHADSLPGGTTARLITFSVSPDGRWLAWGTGQGGSSWFTLRIRDLRTGRDVPDSLRGLNGSRTTISWLRGGSLDRTWQFA